jgi:hypothetical protein
VAEWSKAHAWNACKRHNRFEGSNPSLSAIQKIRASGLTTGELDESLLSRELGGWQTIRRIDFLVSGPTPWDHEIIPLVQKETFAEAKKLLNKPNSS